jgi:hypothetical protein
LRTWKKVGVYASDYKLVESKPDHSEITLRGRPLFAFRREDSPVAGNIKSGVVEVSFDDASRNILVLEELGEGKPVR